MAGFQVIGDEEDDDVVRVFVMTTDYSMQVRNFYFKLLECTLVNGNPNFIIRRL